VLALRIAAPAPLERVDVVTGRGVALRVPLEGVRDVAFEQTLPDLEPGTALYVRVVQQDQGAAWSSPFFVEAPAAPR
jgi:hypothetical protein